MLSYLKSLVVFASGVALAACSGAAGTPSNDADSGIPVVASTNVYGDIAEVIGGDLVRVTSIIDNPSADPEEYEATPRDAAAVAEADLVIVNGGGYDPFLMPLIETAGGEREVLVVTDVSGLQPTDPAETEFNEHVWFSLPAMTELADRIAETLSGISSPDAETFVANAAAFKADLEPLQARVASIKSEHGGHRWPRPSRYPCTCWPMRAWTTSRPKRSWRPARKAAMPPLQWSSRPLSCWMEVRSKLCC